ncbi:Type IV inositol polyphosphate 5-phosphatase [Arachis hypogaea]|nr:Type IV inositol polyphosphate 5-phosphatase [Arachis hypogaea]
MIACPQHQIKRVKPSIPLSVDELLLLLSSPTAPPLATLTAAATFSFFSSFLNTKPGEHSLCLSHSFSFAEQSKLKLHHHRPSSSHIFSALQPSSPPVNDAATFAQALAPWRPKSVPPLAAVPPLSFPCRFLLSTDLAKDLEGFKRGIYFSLIQIHYDHQVLLDYLISKDTGISCAKYLLRQRYNQILCGIEEERKSNYSEKEACTIKKNRPSRRFSDKIHRGKNDLDQAQITDVYNYRIFVATWNVARKSPPSYLNLEYWLHTSPPTDIYVLGFQEIVPLIASNILGTEDNGPARKCLALIRKTLNSLPRTSGGCHTSSPLSDPIIEIVADFEGSMRQKTTSLLKIISV